VKPFHIDMIWNGVRTLESACASSRPGQQFFFPDLAQKLSALAAECRSSDLTFTAILLERLSNSYRNSQPGSAQEFAGQLHECIHRLQDELAEPRFFSVDPNKLEFVRPYPPFFPPEITAMFPAAAREVAEATRCYAFERNTACVFHLMRALEIALKAFADKLNAGFASGSKNWGEVVAALEPRLNSKNTEDAEILAYLRNIKNAWRNPTMHVERDYDAEQTYDILRNTRNLMLHVARRLKSSSA
jgi:hypothetical protein